MPFFNFNFYNNVSAHILKFNFLIVIYLKVNKAKSRGNNDMVRSVE